MADSTPDVTQLLQIARRRHAQTRETKSKLEPHRRFIIAAVLEGLPITTVQSVLEEHCDLEVSYANLRAWIHRQPECRKSKKTDDRTLRRPALTKEQQESMAALEKRSPNDPLTLIRK
jgi:transposase